MDTPALPRETLDSVVIRFAGDSGDGMQITGSQFSQTTALAGNDLATFPDFPAEIRAPAGTTFGVSGFQLHFAGHDVLTPGDEPDVLVAMNPAALKVNLADLRPGGFVIVNTGAFTPGNLKKAGYTSNPLTDGTLAPYRTLEVDVSKLTLDAVARFDLGTKESLRCKNFWTLGLLYWLFDRDREPTRHWLTRKFSKNPVLAEANAAAMDAGHAYAETVELPSGMPAYQVPKAKLEPGQYRTVTGNEAMAWGMAVGAHLAGLQLMLGSYPITPASTLLHYLSNLKQYGVTTFQAEDEIAAVCAAIGASFGGALGCTSTSGPGLALKTEAIGLAIMTELPLVIVDVQRAGPSTGLPTKTEQSDLLQALYGRNGDAPLPVLAACTPADCFEIAVEAVRIATRYMTPVIVLSDGFVANGAEPWKLPRVGDLAPFPAQFHREREGFHPYLRNPETLARAWALPGTPGLEHRIGGLEKHHDSGNISYDPRNHHKMTQVRAAKVAGIARELAPQPIAHGDAGAKVAVVGWGSTYGSIHKAVRNMRLAGRSVAHVHLRHLNPFPANLEALLRSFDHVLVPELNNGMLHKVLRAEFLLPAVGLSKVAGQPFKVSEIERAIDQVERTGTCEPWA
jgi:2-oxoglutarate ferredoxin oxidoreductase subunit alpha